MAGRRRIGPAGAAAATTMVQSRALRNVVGSFLTPEGRRERTLRALGTVDLSRRLTDRPILCGSCGPSQMLRDGSCASCAGRGWMPLGRGWVFVFHAGAPGAYLAPVGGSRLRLLLAPHAGRSLPVEVEE